MSQGQHAQQNMQTVGRGGLGAGASRAAAMSLVARPSLRWVRATASEVMWPCTSDASSSLHSTCQPN